MLVVFSRPAFRPGHLLDLRLDRAASQLYGRRGREADDHDRQLGRRETLELLDDIKATPSPTLPTPSKDTASRSSRHVPVSELADIDELADQRMVEGRARHGGRDIREAGYDLPCMTAEELADAINYWETYIAERAPVAGKNEMTALVAARDNIKRTYRMMEMAVKYREEGR